MANQDDELQQLRNDLKQLRTDFQALSKSLLEPMPALKVDRLEYSVKERVLTRKDAQTDLGLILAPLIAQCRSVQVSFDLGGVDGDLEFTWNEPLRVPAFHELIIEGPHTNNPSEGELRVRIVMTHNRTVDRPPGIIDARDPGRAYVSERARLVLRGLRIHESANDARPLAPSACSGGALLNIDGDFGAVALEQSYVSATEDVIGFGTRTFGRVLFGHTHLGRQNGMVRTVKNPDTQKDEPAPIYAVKRGTGWCFAGAGGIVSRSHTHLGEGVLLDETPSILYLP